MLSPRSCMIKTELSSGPVVRAQVWMAIRVSVLRQGLTDRAASNRAQALSRTFAVGLQGAELFDGGQLAAKQARVLFREPVHGPRARPLVRRRRPRGRHHRERLQAVRRRRRNGHRRSHVRRQRRDRANRVHGRSGYVHRPRARIWCGRRPRRWPKHLAPAPAPTSAFRTMVNPTRKHPRGRHHPRGEGGPHPNRAVCVHRPMRRGPRAAHGDAGLVDDGRGSAVQLPAGAPPPLARHATAARAEQPGQRRERTDAGPG